MATAANNIRLTVNQWLADNQSQYAGYAPFSNAVGTDVVIDGVTFQKGKIAEAYTTDYAHPSPVGMQLEADLIPLSWFKAADATPAANEASVKGLWVATNKAPTNGLWMIASNSGSKVKDTAGQQTAVHLLATDTSFNDEIDTSDYPGSRTGGYYGNAYNELGDVASTIQRGTAAAPYVAAKNVDQSIAVWRRYGYGTRGLPCRRAWRLCGKAATGRTATTAVFFRSITRFRRFVGPCRSLTLDCVTDFPRTALQTAVRVRGIPKAIPLPTVGAVTRGSCPCTSVQLAP